MVSDSEAAAIRLIKGWLEFSTLRYYATDLQATHVEGPGDVVLTLVLRVPHWEIEVHKDSYYGR